ncbi:hypothetical protein QVN42_08070 [Yersinia nurmii]|uniref:Uncharacterized protein n=1 Tax=Yersinia nurmii TaxID=685706 RepID=A0AAW7JXJ9_9GAMM|nr:hypothetical protein [Yersinia nurmii]MDN0087349.1 hypothetical protein [Yersinia nurmii]CNE92254.1 Uncharacterised protein [Yersinia nurmii]
MLVSVNAYRYPTAILCGRVIVDDDVYVVPYAVMRADEMGENGADSDRYAF